MEGSLSTRVATPEDLAILEPMWQANCKRMHLEWSKYIKSAKMILSSLDFGFCLIAEQAGTPVGFALFTYEWSDWRDGVFFWLQGLEGASAEILQLLKTATEEYGANKIEYKLCGIRLCSQKVYKKEDERAKNLWDLDTSHYYIYHVDTQKA